MQALTADGPNAEQIRYWNEMAGPKWVAFDERINAHIASFGGAALGRAAIGAGERVLDVGCGCGHSTVELARRVGADGSVLGIDLSSAMLARAQERAQHAGLTHVRFEQADAQTHRFSPSTVDLLYSRFGVMFFADPVAAFSNLRAALRPGGRVAFVCWQPLAENDWALIPFMAAAQHITLPPPPAPNAPGPFAFGDAERVRHILTQAGFDDVQVESVRELLALGGAGDLDEGVNFLLQVGPAAAALRQAPEQVPAVAAAIREAIAPYVTADGVRMRGAAWIVTARRPA